MTMRKVFFSFYYRRDNWRVIQVRNSWVTKPGQEACAFLDRADWANIHAQGHAKIQEWIDNQLGSTSVTVVLIGKKTAGREWVDYEITKTHNDGKGMIGVYIHQLKNKDGQTDTKGANPFDRFEVAENGSTTKLSALYDTYDWIDDDGYNNLAGWVEKAAQAAGR